MTDAAAHLNLYRVTAELTAEQLIEIDPAVAGSLPSDCLPAVLGIVPTHIGRGACRAEMTIGRRHLNQRGIAQAGAVVALADATAGWASYAAVESGRFTTLDLTCSLLRAVTEGDVLVAEARPVHLGRRTLVFGVDVQHVQNPAEAAGRRSRRVARFSCTQLVLDAAVAQSAGPGAT